MSMIMASLRGGVQSVMATLMYRKHRLNSSGDYDTIYTETSSECVMRPNGSTVESAIKSLADNKVAGSRTIAGHDLWSDISRKDLLYFGDNILSKDNDTTSNWSNLGPGYSFYSDSGTITDKPSTWGILVSFPYGSDIFQFWSVQNTGPLYVRQGNAAGWGRTWAKIMDSDCITKTTSDPGAGSSLVTDNICLVYE